MSASPATLPVPAARSTRPTATRKASKAPRTVSKAQRRVAAAVALSGAFVLGLSVWDCTAALCTLTGMPVILSALLAIGIDVGMVSAEAAAIVSGEGRESKKWAERYVGGAVLLSVLLNATAAAGHASGAASILAAGVGGCIPLLVYGLGRVSGALWTGR